MHEIHRLAHARGVELRKDAVSRSLGFVDGLPEEATASMQRDIMHGRPSELEAQSGAVVRLAAVTNVPVPTHRFIYAALRPLELRARGELQFD